MAIREALERLERAVVHDGGSHLRRLVLDGQPYEAEWPTDLPPLPADARTWLGWRSPGEDMVFLSGPDGALVQLLGFEQAGELTRELQAELPGFVMLLDGTPSFACDANGRVVRVESDDVPRTAVPLDQDIAALVDAIAARYAQRRSSPWRRQRIDVDDEATWSEGPGALDDLEHAPPGTAIAWVQQARRRRRAWFAAKLDDRWAVTSIRWDDELDPADACASLRADFARGDVEAHDSAGLAAKIASTGRANRPPLEAARGSVFLWTQPSMASLLDDLAAATDDLPIRFAPGIEDPAIVDEQLRALYAFANGSETAIFFRYRLVPIAEARETSRALLELATTQFGEPYWHPSFVPFLDKGNGDNIYLDTDGIHGPPGSLVDFDHERPEERRVLYDSVAQWLECLVEGLEVGLYEWADEAVFPRFFLEDGDLDEIRQHDAIYTNGAYPWTRRLRLADG